MYSDDRINQSRHAGKRKMLKEIVEVFLNKLILFYPQNSFLLGRKIKKDFNSTKFEYFKGTMWSAMVINP